MKIEPCPLCGCPCGISDDDVVSCTNYSYRYDSDCALEVHNRLSRIVRAAEELAKALKDERDNEYRDEYTDVVNKAEVALEEAVEGSGE